MLGQAVLSPSLVTCQLGRNVPFGSNSVGPKEDWDYDGKRILGHIGADIYLWEAATGKVLWKFSGHRESPQSLRFSPDGRYILSSSGVRTGGDFPPDCKSVDTSTRLWDVTSGKQIWEIRNVFAGAFSPDSKRILMLSLRDCNDSPATVTMWDSSGKKLFDAHGPNLPHKGNGFSAIYTRIAFSPDGRRFASEEYNDEALLYDAANGNQLAYMGDASAFHFYGRHGEIETYDDGHVRLWSRDGRMLREIRHKSDNFSSAGSSYDGRYVIDLSDYNYSSWKRMMGILDIETGHLQSAHVEGVDLTASPLGDEGVVWRGGGQANSGYTPLQFNMYDLITGKELWHGQEEAYSFLGFAPDGQTFLVGGGPNFVVYSTKTGEALSSVDLLGTCQGGNGLGGFAEPHPDCVPGGSR